MLFLLLFAACGKADEKLTDARNKYIGSYFVHEKIGSYGPPPYVEPFLYEKETIINVLPGETDSTLLVLGREVWLDSNGSYYEYKYGLRLWNDSLRSYYSSGGMGGGMYISHVGYRISTEPVK